MRRVKPRSLGLALLVVLAVVGLFVLLYAAARHAYTADSDGATVLLEGHSMLSGHPLLGGWAISLDSFWTVDALWNLVAVALAGVRPDLLYAVPAAIATAVIVVGVIIATRGRRGWAAVTAGATVVAILAFPTHALAVFFLRGPLHVGTVLWCLLAFLALRRGRFGWGFAAAVVLLAAGLLGDLQMLALGVLPVGLAGLTTMARNRRWQSGAPLVVAALGGLALAEAVRRIARAIGTFSIARANPIAPLHTAIANLKHGGHEGLQLMGVGSSYYGLGGEPAALADTRLIAVLVVLVAVAGGIVSLVHGVVRGRATARDATATEAPILDDLLVFAALASPAAFALLAITGDPQFGRYLTAGIIFGAVLAGRMIGRFAEALRGRVTAARVVAAVGVAAVACYAVGTATTLAQPVPVAGAAQLASFLESHHLRQGLGAYWSSSITTVQSDGRVEVRPVVDPPGRSTLVRYLRNSDDAWYAGLPRTAPRFVVYQPAPAGQTPWGSVDERSARATFGPPSRVYDVAGYRILVWDHPLRLPRR